MKSHLPSEEGVFGSLRGALAIDTGWSRRVIRERPLKGKDKRNKDKKRNGIRKRVKMGKTRGGRRERQGERGRQRRTESETNHFKQVLSVIYICLQNEKCVP